MRVPEMFSDHGMFMQRNPNRAVRRCLNWVYRMLEAIDS